MDSFKNIYSFDHIIEIIQNSRVNLSVKPIFYSKIYEFIGNSNVKKLESDERFYLRDVKSVQFRKYSSKIYLKLDYKEKYNEKSILNIKMTQLLEKNIGLNKNSNKKYSIVNTIPKQNRSLGIEKLKLDKIKQNLEGIDNKYMEFYNTLRINYKRKCNDEFEE